MHRFGYKNTLDLKLESRGTRYNGSPDGGGESSDRAITAPATSVPIGYNPHNIKLQLESFILNCQWLHEHEDEVTGMGHFLLRKRGDGAGGCTLWPGSAAVGAAGPGAGAHHCSPYCWPAYASCGCTITYVGCGWGPRAHPNPCGGGAATAGPHASC